MRLGDERESQNVEDRRGGGGLPIGVAGGGIGTIALVVLGLLFGIDPSVILSSVGGGDAVQQRAPAPSANRSSGPPGQPDEMRQFVSRVLASTEDVWTAVFQANGRRYDPPRLVLFSGGVQSACGAASTAVGPFYCPGDRQVYLDLAFFRDMERQLGASGDFAQAYVIAHEVGHHVQNEMGIMRRADALRARGGEVEVRAVSVRVELQADCFAGVWANRANQSRAILERGDIEEGLNAAAAVGDDRIQRRSQGQVVPESFTHGSSAQRVRWFRRGLQSGDVQPCDTFG